MKNIFKKSYIFRDKVLNTVYLLKINVSASQNNLLLLQINVNLVIDSSSLD